MNHYLVECCANSIQSAIQAEVGGANRVEFCANLEVGGITPLKEDIITLINSVNIPIRILIRPRAGDFIYSEDEIIQMIADIQFCKTIGSEGVVIGVLTKEGRVDINQTKRLAHAAKPMHVTFHRAFDEGNDLQQNLEDVIASDCDTLLTSGQAKNVALGLENLKKLVRISVGRINILAGSGVNHTNTEALYKIGIRNFHLSGSEKNMHGVLGTNSRNIQAVVKKLEDIV